MAPGSLASSDTLISSASLTSMTSTSGWSGTLKPGPLQHAVPPPRRNPPMLRMVLEALQAGEQRRGTSVMAIKLYILQKYPTVDAIRLKYLLKRALDTGMQRGLLIRPINSRARGATGSFKLVPKQKKKIQPRKTATVSAPRRPGEAKEEAPKKDGQTKGEEARGGKARKAPQQPDKATEAPPGASGPHGKLKIKGKKDSPADAKAHRKTKAGTRSSKPTVPKSENGVTAPAKKKTGNKVLKEATAQGARKGSKAKAAAAPKDSESKMVQPLTTRKTEVPRGPRRPGTSTTASSSKETRVKAEAKS
ncbi:PREDICTED: histone H1oo [Myotis brandtii]|uniref:histone H1oo n=1 Tax=Myotis brandtii TaxID=109478 RepID=UPI0003BB8AC6|nr:PREDICTED: histone H1oo [Myotis brandtii]